MTFPAPHRTVLRPGPATPSSTSRSAAARATRLGVCLLAATLLGLPATAAGVASAAPASASRSVAAADLAAALPTGEQLRPIGGSLWYQGTISVVSGLQEGFPADPQVASGYLSTVATGPLTVSLSRFTSATDARARARAAAEGASGGPAALTTVPDVGDGGWLYLDATGKDTSCTVRWTAGSIIGRMTLRLGERSSAVAAKRCTIAGMSPLLGAARATAQRTRDVAAGRLRSAPVPSNLAALLPPLPSGARALGTVVQSSDAWGVDIVQLDSLDLSGTDGRVPFRRTQRILGEAGATRLATTHFAIGGAALVATVGTFRSGEAAQSWVHELLGDNPSEETPQHTALPGSSLGYEVRWGKGTGRAMKPTDHVLRVAVGNAAIDLHCARPFDADPLDPACSRALDATARAWARLAGTR